MEKTPAPVRHPKEEFLNSLTHGLGALLSAIGIPILLIQAAKTGNPWHMLACAVFGASMLATLGASAFYHGAVEPERKRLLRIADHAAIFTLIAGGYTPFCLMSIPGALGLTLLGVVWTVALFGIVLKLFHTGRFERLSLMLYLGMGWMSMVAIGPMIENMLVLSLGLLVASGVLFTLGVVFYTNDHKPGFHLVWHLFVLAACGCLYGAVLTEIPVPA
ncbi:MAG: hemolysin III family protein [Planctomycetota bacterium]|jgi:hemolysin III|nr:hemolysin D [Planctomycetota bacterium]MDP6370734.1 hemolysin III family protein [Planctomycetota bacterium]MDP6518743.1 hemolysin III family protein [Planctomycetota bacterium]MDP6837494.1 hemolysin III family protein [Planctomycetota bacterium]